MAPLLVTRTLNEKGGRGVGGSGGERVRKRGWVAGRQGGMQGGRQRGEGRGREGE